MTEAEATTTYLHTVARARARSTAEDWSKAARLWDKVVAGNPVNGTFWAHLADARYHTKEYRDAIAAYEQALELGSVDESSCFPFAIEYRIACCFALLGEREPALDWLARAFGLGYRDPEYAWTDDDLHSLRDDARFRDIVAWVDTSGLSRDEGWRSDLRILTREVKRKAYDPFRQVSEEDFDVAVDKISAAIPQLTDMQVIVEMRKLLRLLGDGHAGISGTELHPDLQQTLPLQFYLFEEGLHIIAAHPQYRDLLGARVLRFGERTVDEVIEALDAVICRDNAYWPKEVAPYRMRELPLLHALGLIPEARRVDLTILDGEGRTSTVSVPTDANRHTIDYAVPPVKVPARDPEGWLTYPETLATPLPLYLKNVDAAYWFEYPPAARLVYFQFNAVRNEREESLTDFCERLFAFIEAGEVDQLVIDMRWNGGGNTFLEMPLLHRLIGCRKVNRRGRLFVIIGRATFSAAQNGATKIAEARPT
jgi:tetratricopeptide (TPR) repeat protein